MNRKWTWLEIKMGRSFPTYAKVIYTLGGLVVIVAIVMTILRLVLPIRA